MAKFNSEKTISANSNGIVISYGDANKHQFMRYETPSHIKKIQLEGTVKYQQIEKPFRLNPKQKDLYNKLVYGFKAYTTEEIAGMSKSKKLSVTINYTKAQRILNHWKQDLSFSLVDKLLTTIFPKSSVAKAMINAKGYLNDVSKEHDISLEEFGIKKQQIIGKFLEAGLLPKNFYELI